MLARARSDTSKKIWGQTVRVGPWEAFYGPGTAPGLTSWVPQNAWPKSTKMHFRSILSVYVQNAFRSIAFGGKIGKFESHQILVFERYVCLRLLSHPTAQETPKRLMDRQRNTNTNFPLTPVETLFQPPFLPYF